MTVSNGSTIEKSDLDAQLRPFAPTLATENARNCGLHEVTFDFVGLLDSTVSALRTHTFTVPDDDMELLDFGGYVVGANGLYTLTLAGGPLIYPVSVSATLSSSPDHLSRYSDGTEPFQVLLRGATYTVVAETAASTGTNIVRGFVLLRTRPRRR